MKNRRRLLLLLVFCAVGIAAAGLAGRGSGSQATLEAGGPDSRTQPLADGCARERGAILTHEVPNWVYVGDGEVPAGLPPPTELTVARGVVDSQYQPERAAEPTGTDDPFTHTSYDFTFNVKPDPAYENLLGTGNLEGTGSESNRLHIERESATFPMFAWPDRGDRVVVVGSWVWDCDHTTAAGEHTEMHPFNGIWVERNPGGPSPRSPVGEREADVFFTNAGTPADTQALCAHETKGNRAAFKSCLALPVENVVPGSDLIPGVREILRAPPKPSPNARLVYRVVDHGSNARLSIQRVYRGLEVSFSVAQRSDTVIAKQIFVGWRPVKTRPVHLRVRIRELLVRRAMDPGCPPYDLNCPAKDESTLIGQVTTSPGEWNVYVDAGGVWTPWSPILVRPKDGQTIRSKQAIDLFVAKGRPWRLFVQTRECDFGSLGNAYSIEGEVSPCPHILEVGNTASDDQPGIAVVHFRSPESSLGTHRVNSSLEGSTCPPSNTKGCYRVTFTISRIRP